MFFFSNGACFLAKAWNAAAVSDVVRQDEAAVLLPVAEHVG